MRKRRGRPAANWTAEYRYLRSLIVPTPQGGAVVSRLGGDG